MCCEGPSRRWTHVVRFHSKNLISRDGEYRNCYSGVWSGKYIDYNSMLQAWYGYEQ